MSPHPPPITRRGAALALALSLLSCGKSGPTPPETRRDDTIEVLHGVSIADPYRWLEDGQSEQTRAWIAGQAAHTQSVLAAAPPADEVRRRLEKMVRFDETSVPTGRGGRYFFARRPADRDHPILYVRSPGGADEVLVDPRDLPDDGPVAVGYADVSSDGSLVAYTVQRDGEYQKEVRFVDVDSGDHRADVLPRGRYVDIAIDADGTGVYYNMQTPEGPRVSHHVFGEPADSDRVVFGRGYGPEKAVTSSLSSNGRYLLITVHDGSAGGRSELYFRDTWTGTLIHTIVNDIDAHFEGHIAGDVLFVLTDWEAPNGRVFAANLRRPAIDSWTEIIGEADDPIEGLTAVGGRLLVHRLDGARSRLTVHEPDGFPVREVTFAEVGTVSTPGSGTWESDEIFFAVSSVARPPTVYRYRVSDGDRGVWAENRAPVEPTDFETEQVNYDSADGASSPMLVSHLRGLKLDGTQRALLTGAGAFGAGALPSFDPLAVAWMELGGIWASAGLQGRAELGASWHRAGALEREVRDVDDLIAAAEWLIRGRYAAADRLAIRGEATGGLLVGAAVTRRPDLFAAAVARHTVLDMLRYQLFLDGPRWVTEYGSAEDPGQFERLADFSPYHRIVDGARYPSIMLVAAANDPSVSPLHARKMTARLQASTGSANPVVLRYDDGVGSARAWSPPITVDGLTDELRFLLRETR
jgi:prolyl oligopeptidase